MFSRYLPLRFSGLALAGALLFTGCADAPHLTTLAEGMGSFALAPYFATQSPGQGGALAAAFDRVNRFRVVLTRIPGGEVALDTVLEVSPGQSVYDLDLQVELRSQDEQFSAVITALAGDEVLFTSPPLTVKPTLAGETPPAPLNIPLTYSGPGSEAVALNLAPDGYAFSPGGSATFSVEILDPSGNLIPDVPLSWSLDLPSVASVGADGLVQANAEGIAQLTVTTPNGLSASAWIYVADAELAYVRDGDIYIGTLNFSAGAQVEPVVEDADAPVWGPDGSSLFFERGGFIWQMGVEDPLIQGGFPSIHPDGTKLAFEGGGTVFANTDGTNPTPGPEGSYPIWLDSEKLLVLGPGGLQRVRADGAERATVVASSSVAYFCLGPDGKKIAFLDGSLGHVFVSGVLGDRQVRVFPQDPSSGLTARGRPALSPLGEWVLVEADGRLYLVPSSGTGPPLPVIGSEGVSQPAWIFEGTLEAPPSVSVSGYTPQNPAPGDEVVIVGSGFDWIIPRNNQVIYPEPASSPTPGNPEAAEGDDDSNILSATANELRSRVPMNVGQGSLRIATRGGGEVSLPFTPAAGTLDVLATKGPDRGVPGVSISVLQDGTPVATGTTDAAGKVSISGLGAGSYEITASPPPGFEISGENPQSITLNSGQNTSADVALLAKVFSIQVEPDALLLELGESADLTATLWDIQGDPILEDRGIQWGGTSQAVDAVGSGENGTATGIFPTPVDAPTYVVVRSEGVPAQIPVHITSSIQGRVTFGAVAAPEFSLTSGGPQAAVAAPGVTVNLLSGSRLLDTQDTDQDGAFRFSPLPGGTYTVEVVGGSPRTQNVTLDQSTPAPEVSFHYTGSTGGSGGGDFVVFNDINVFDNQGMAFPDNQLMLRNLIAVGGSRSTGTVVWWDRGRSSNCGSGCSTSSFFTTAGILQGEGLTVQEIFSTSGSLTSIPANVRVIFLWNPNVYYTWQEINALKSFAQEGGRIIFIGEHGSYYSGFHVENRFFADMGSQMTVTGDWLDCGFHDLPADRILPHQVTEGMTQYRMACSSYLTPGGTDTPLILSQEAPTRVIVAVGDIDFTPLPPSAVVAPAPGALSISGLPARSDGLVDPDGSGTVFLKGKATGKGEVRRKR